MLTLGMESYKHM